MPLRAIGDGPQQGVGAPRGTAARTAETAQPVPTGGPQVITCIPEFENDVVGAAAAIVWLVHWYWARKDDAAGTPLAASKEAA